MNIGNLEQFDSLPEYDLFFSLIVLQHNPPPLMALILEKVLARLAPGGVAYFQTATHMTDYHFSVAAYLETPPMVGNAKVHCLPQHVLFELVQRAGCDILEIREDSSLGETTVSNRLLLRKRDGTSGHGSLQRFTMNEPDQRPVDQPLGVPQRYSINRERYELRGGLIRLTEDARGFIANGANHDDMARFYFLCLVFDQIVTEQLTGDFAELGVYRGHTASLLAQMARHLGRTAFLLDTYAGFDAADVKGIDAGVEMAFVDTSLEAVRALVGDRNVRFVQGHFPESAAQLPQEGTYCLVHLDCDLYAPMIAALNYFYTRLVPGGFLIIHDYSSLHWNGVERAVHEFLCDKSESLVPMPDSAGSIIIRKTRSARRRDNWYARRIATVFGPDWISGGNGSLGPALEYGWSAPEQWGVWGIDEVHRLRVVLGTPPTADIVLEFDVSAFLLENATRREVLVKANGQMIDRWIFIADDNRRVRVVHLAAGLPVDDDFPSVLVEFVPTECAVVADMREGSLDRRRLGVALHRVRRPA